MGYRFFCLTRRLWPVLVLTLAAFGAEPGAKVASTLPSDRLNRGLPSWLRFSGEERVRTEGWTGIGYKDSQDLFVLNRLRINFQVAPSRWLKFNFQGQDSRVWGNNVKPAPATQKDSLDLRLAYVELGDAEKAPVTLTVGRQSLAFGEGRLIADSDWSNTGRTFDAVRATLHHGKMRLDAFASSVVKMKDGEFNKRVDGDNFHGLYGSLQNLVPNATVEPYLLWRLAPKVRAESGVAGKLDSKTAGVRWVWANCRRTSTMASKSQARAAPTPATASAPGLPTSCSATRSPIHTAFRGCLANTTTDRATRIPPTASEAASTSSIPKVTSSAWPTSSCGATCGMPAPGSKSGCGPL